MSFLLISAMFRWTKLTIIIVLLVSQSINIILFDMLHPICFQTVDDIYQENIILNTFSNSFLDENSVIRSKSKEHANKTC